VTPLCSDAKRLPLTFSNSISSSRFTCLEMLTLTGPFRALLEVAGAESGMCDECGYAVDSMPYPLLYIWGTRLFNTAIRQLVYLHNFQISMRGIKEMRNDSGDEQFPNNRGTSSR
jgi:hypothetical protein